MSIMGYKMSIKHLPHCQNQSQIDYILNHWYSIVVHASRSKWR